jgi:hypothetical protein
MCTLDANIGLAGIDTYLALWEEEKANVAEWMVCAVGSVRNCLATNSPRAAS